jgi:hypothetical protein
MPTTVGGTPTVLALDFHGPLLYVGGTFSGWTNGIQPSTRTNLAVMDTRDGSLLSWNPAPNSTVWCLDATGNRLLAGGEFGRFLNERCFALADVDLQEVPTVVLATEPDAPLSTIELRQSYPNPARGSAQIAFDLALEGEVALDVFDVQGRRVATPISSARFQPGRHQVRVATTGWRPGIYLYRLRVGAESRTRSMIVIE